METPDNLKYTREHEWVKLEEGKKNIIVGLTEYAQEQLGDIVYVELPSVGEEVGKDDPMGVVESVKAVSDCYAPLSGKIVEVNDLLADNPETINEDCYGEAWLVKIEVKDSSELESFMDNVEYETFVSEEAAG